MTHRGGPIRTSHPNPDESFRPAATAHAVRLRPPSPRCHFGIAVGIPQHGVIMSRNRTRGRKRRARLGAAVAEFARVRDNPQALLALLTRLAASDVSVWAVAQSAAGGAPLDDDERALIAQTVAPHLVAMTPGEVRHRHAAARLTN